MYWLNELVLIRVCRSVTLLGSGLLEVGDQVGAVLWLLESGKDHLCARDVLLGVEEVVIEGLLLPLNSHLLVGLGVGESSHLARGSSEESSQVGPLCDGVSVIISIGRGGGDIMSGPRSTSTSISPARWLLPSLRRGI